MRFIAFVFLALYVCGLPASSFASEVSAAEIADYLSPARTLKDYVQLVRNPEQQKYLKNLIKEGNLKGNFQADITSEKPNALVIQGSWGKLKFDFAKSDKKRIWINSESFPVKNFYELHGLDPRPSAFWSPIREAHATENNYSSFFRVVGSALYSWWYDSSRDINKSYLVRDFRCTGERFDGLTWGEQGTRYELGYAKDGSVNKVILADDVSGPYCTYTIDKKGIVTKLERKSPSSCRDRITDPKVKTLDTVIGNFEMKKPFKHFTNCCKSYACKSTMQRQARSNHFEYTDYTAAEPSVQTIQGKTK